MHSHMCSVEYELLNNALRIERKGAWMKAQNARPSVAGLRRATHEDLARRIRALDLGTPVAEGVGEIEPRWIEPAELVRRVAPWLSQN